MDILGILWLPDFLVWILIVAATLYLYATWTHGALEKYGYKGPKPKPFIGNNDLNFEGHTGAWDLEGKRLYGKTFAIYEGREPTIMTFDVDFLKQMLVKDFSKFTDRRDLLLRGKKLGRSLLDLHGDEWRRVRNLLTPFFSTGKLKGNMQKLEYCVNKLKTRCEPLAESGEQFNAKELFGVFSLEAICRLAFGLKVDSETDPNHILLTTAKKLMAGLTPEEWSFKLLSAFPIIVYTLDWLGFDSIPAGAEANLTEFTRTAIEERKKSEKKHPDFIQAMIKAHEEDLNSKTSSDISNGTTHDSTGRGKSLTEDEIVGQVALFFLAGYDTVSTTCMFLMYNLGAHPEWQDKVLAEINTTFGDGEVTYEKLKETHILDACMSESQRLFPSLPRLDRKCTEDTTINGHYIPKGTLVNVPVWALHHDPEYWQDPETYNPDRFSPENKGNIEQFAFYPFGIGPRNCVGMRLAQIEVKMAVIKILRSFKVKVGNRTKRPLKFTPGFFAAVKTGVWLHLEKR